MRFHIRYLIPFVMIAGCGGPLDAGTDSIDQELAHAPHAAVCPGPAAAGNARCHARVIVDASGQPAFNSTPRGYVPDDLQAAYNLGSTSTTKTVAIIDAYDNPNAEADMNVYRQTFGLPACTTANGCFKKVNQQGQAGSYPKSDIGWGQEIALDLDMVSAICPTCHIILVETSSPAFTDLGEGVNTAASLGAVAISNSWGGSEFSSETSYESYFDHPGISITVSSGDSGYGAEFPASSRFVTAVGGTHLTRASGARGFTETAWSGAGSGCSAYIPKPTWQKDSGCAKRTVADVSAVADPNTGVAVYDTFGHRNSVGWLVFGGTSAAAPIIAAVYARAGNGAAPSYPYAHTSALYDVVGGSNGSCGGTYLCTAVAGYDGPTGLGSPNGSSAF